MLFLWARRLQGLMPDRFVAMCFRRHVRPDKPGLTINFLADFIKPSRMAVTISAVSSE
jgi:hypothetical protein